MIGSIQFSCSRGYYEERGSGDEAEIAGPYIMPSKARPALNIVCM